MMHFEAGSVERRRHALSKDNPEAQPPRANLIWIPLAFGAACAMARLGCDLREGAATAGPTAPDFLCFWIAARAAVAGQAAALYDWSQMLPMIERALGHGFDGFLPWKYPPGALLILSPLAVLSLSAAHLAWAIGTLAAFLGVIFRIAGRNAVLAALAAPLTAQEVIMGQNGFATAAVIGGTLLLSENKRFQAGLLAGVLSCKPQLCLLMPLIVLTRCGWRGVAGAVTSGVVFAGVSAVAFGVDAWRAFFLSIHGNVVEFGQGAVPWSALQSLYAHAQVLGVSGPAAAAMQAALIFCVLVATVRLERLEVPVELRNAAVCAGTVLVTPFILIWDLPVVGMGIAFLVRAIGDKDYHPLEIIGLVWLVLSTWMFFVAGISVGCLDGLVLLLLVYRRCFPRQPEVIPSSQCE
jgi:hypothetical protein